MNVLHRWSWYTGLLIIAIGTGCVQSQAFAEKPEPSRLMISRGANGVNMQWKGLEGAFYALYYRDAGAADQGWKIVPGYERVAGTGALIQYRDTAPTARSRKYRVHTLKPAPFGKSSSGK